jgi:hypothetical protein
VETRLLEMERRVAHAARQVRLLYGGVLLVLITVVALSTARPAITQGTGSTVKAPFRVVDAAGRTIVQVDAAPDGALLSLYSSRGLWVAKLYATGEGYGRLEIVQPGVTLIPDGPIQPVRPNLPPRSSPRLPSPRR